MITSKWIYAILAASLSCFSTGQEGGSYSFNDAPQNSLGTINRNQALEAARALLRKGLRGYDRDAFARNLLEKLPEISVTPDANDVALRYHGASVGFDPSTGMVHRAWMNADTGKGHVYDIDECADFAKEYALMVLPSIELEIGSIEAKVSSNSYVYRFRTRLSGRNKERRSLIDVSVERAGGTLKTLSVATESDTPVGPDDPALSREQVVASVGAWWRGYEGRWENADVVVGDIQYRVPKDADLIAHSSWYRQCSENGWSVITYSVRVNDVDSWNSELARFDRYLYCLVDAVRGDVHSVVTSDVLNALRETSGSEIVSRKGGADSSLSSIAGEISGKNCSVIGKNGRSVNEGLRLLSSSVPQGKSEDVSLIVSNRILNAKFYPRQGTVTVLDRGHVVAFRLSQPIRFEENRLAPWKDWFD